MAVDADPTAVEAVWYPGLNKTRCTEPITHGPAAIARRLTRDILKAKPYPPGSYSCPADFGRAVQLYFRYAGQHDEETVVVLLTGCQSITAPGRATNLESGDLTATDLRQLTPPDLREPPR